MNSTEIVLIIIYEGLSIFSGYRILSGRSEWLDTPAPLNAIVKFVVCLLVGNLIAAFYVAILIFKLAFKLATGAFFK